MRLWICGTEICILMATIKDVTGEEKVKTDWRLGKDSFPSSGFSLSGVRFYTVFNLQTLVDMRPRQRLKAGQGKQPAEETAIRLKRNICHSCMHFGL